MLLLLLPLGLLRFSLLAEVAVAVVVVVLIFLIILPACSWAMIVIMFLHIKLSLMLDRDRKIFFSYCKSFNFLINSNRSAFTHTEHTDRRERPLLFTLLL